MLQINTNIMTLNAARSSARNETSLARSIQRLSSGLRINSARDDAAGLAIAERMTAQVRGLTQAARNMNDAVSLLQTGEGALASLGELMQRGRELAVQAANGVNSAQNRQSLQSEIEQILAEVDRISQTTEFNGKLLFDKGDAPDPAPAISLLAEKQAIVDGLRTGWLANSERMIEEYFGLTGTGVELEIILDDTIPGASAYVSGTGSATLMNLELHIDVQELDAVGISYPNSTIDQLIAHEMTHAIMGVTTNFVSMENWFREGTAEFIPGGDGRLGAVMDGTIDTQTPAQVAANIDNIRGAFGGSHLDYATAYAATRYLHDAIGGDGVKGMLSYLAADTTRTLDDWFATGAVAGIADTDAFVADFKANGAAFIQAMDLANDDTGAIGGADADGGTRNTTSSGTIPDTPGDSADPLAGFDEIWPDLSAPVTLATNRSLEFQVGARADQTLTVSGRHISTASLGIDGVDVVSAPNWALDAFSEAIEAINGVRAEYGAAQNRLESAIRSSQVAAETTSASRSRIVDADYAAETAALTRAQILQRASTAMVAQANAQPRVVLSLLRAV